ncbi:MAG: outer membrane protein transport protein [Gammaproteobacteria bacterium]|nr:MAG: outer membrane protein transport protein [Gammaproteobacteria bacterium]
MHTPSRILLTVSVFLSLFISAQSYGAGFAIIEHSVKGLGNAFAGGSASAEDATTIYFNPAGMSRLQGKQLIVGTHIIMPSANFKDQGSVDVTTAPLTGGDGGDGGVTAVVPNLYWTFPINEKMRFGLGINAPFGLSTEYDSNWQGRYHAIDSLVETVNINPSLSFKLNDKASIGFGINVQYMSVELSNAIDLGLITSGGGGVPQAEDAIGEVDGASWALGFNVGFLYQFSEKTRFGVAYRSKIEHTLDGGDAKFYGVNPTGSGKLAFLQSSNTFVNTGVEADITLPESLSLSIFRQMNPKWAIMGDITWTRWSRFKELVIEYDVGAQGNTVTPENWDDSLRISFGANYKLNDKWLLRFGAALDETPIPSAADRTPRVPGNDRKWLTFGASYKGPGKVSFDMGFAHLFVSDTKINNTTSLGHTLTGKYSADVNILSFQANWDY